MNLDVMRQKYRKVGSHWELNPLTGRPLAAQARGVPRRLLAFFTFLYFRLITSKFSLRQDALSIDRCTTCMWLLHQLGLLVASLNLRCTHILFVPIVSKGSTACAYIWTSSLFCRRSGFVMAALVQRTMKSRLWLTKTTSYGFFIIIIISWCM